MDREEYERSDPERRDRRTGRDGGTRRKDYSGEFERFFVEGDEVRGWRVHRIVSCTNRKITAQCSWTIWGKESSAVDYAEILSSALDLATDNVRLLGNLENADRLVSRHLFDFLQKWGLPAHSNFSAVRHTASIILMTVCLDLNLPIPKSLREVLAESLRFFYGR